jgi:CBS domain-containing protein
MIPLDKYPHIPHWFTMRQALAEMEHAEFDVGARKSLPRVVLVFDEEYSLLGIVRRRDILRGLEPEFLSKVLAESSRWEAETGQPDTQTSQKIRDSIKKRVERPVSDVMMRLETTVDIDDTIVDIANKIVDSNVSLLPVMKEGEVVGVVRTVELLNEVSKVVD